jgi:hypothetical protein
MSESRWPSKGFGALLLILLSEEPVLFADDTSGIISNRNLGDSVEYQT